MTDGRAVPGATHRIPWSQTVRRVQVVKRLRGREVTLLVIAGGLCLAVWGPSAAHVAFGPARAVAPETTEWSRSSLGHPGSEATPALPEAARCHLPLVVGPGGNATPRPSQASASGTPNASPGASTPTGAPSADVSPTPSHTPSASQPTSVPPATTTPAPTDPWLTFEGERAMEHARHQCALGPRPPGTTAHWQTGSYAASVLAAAGWRIELDSFRYRDVPLRNVIGRRGSGPALLVGAHYDTRRIADRELDPWRRQQPIEGGNDGASGVAVVLELARVLAVQASQREIWLVLFDAEDQGGIDGWEWFVGSTRLAERLASEPQGTFDALILLDMVGDRDQRICRAADSTPHVADALLGVAAHLGFGAWLRGDCAYYVSDDHTPFLARGLAAVDLIDFDYPFWHTLDDTCDAIGANELERVGRTVEAWIEQGAPRATPAAGATGR